MAHTLLRSLHAPVSVEHRREAAYRARLASYTYDTPLQGRCKRFAADVMTVRRAAQDHAPGRVLDAAFLRLTQAPLLPTRNTLLWQDRAKLMGCMLATAVRYVLDVLACIVGAVIGAASSGRDLRYRGRLHCAADPQVMRQAIESRLREGVALELAEHPLQGEALARQFKLDHHRQTVFVDGKAWARDDDFADKAVQLTAFCHDDARWAQNVSLVLNQTPGVCAGVEATMTGDIRLGELHVKLWEEAGGAPLPAAERSAFYLSHEPDGVAVRGVVAQRLAVLRVGRPGAALNLAELEELPCDGFLRSEVTLRIPRPGNASAAAFDVTGFTLTGRVEAPAPVWNTLPNAA